MKRLGFRIGRHNSLSFIPVGLVVLVACRSDEASLSVNTQYFQAARSAGAWMQAQADPQWGGAIPDEVGVDSAPR